MLYFTNTEQENLKKRRRILQQDNSREIIIFVDTRMLQMVRVICLCSVITFKRSTTTESLNVHEQHFEM